MIAPVLTITLLGVLAAQEGVATLTTFDSALARGNQIVERHCYEADPKLATEAEWRTATTSFETAARLAASIGEKKRLYAALDGFYACKSWRDDASVADESRRRSREYRRLRFELDPSDGEAVLIHAGSTLDPSARAKILRTALRANPTSRVEIEFELQLAEFFAAPAGRPLDARLKNVDLAALPGVSLRMAVDALRDAHKNGDLGYWCGSWEEFETGRARSVAPFLRGDNDLEPTECAPAQCDEIRAYLGRFKCGLPESKTQAAKVAKK